MRRILIAINIAAVTLVLGLGSAALAQTNTPTSFFGGPDVSTDATSRVPAPARDEGPVVAGTADEDDDGSSATGWVVGALVLVAVIGVGAFLMKRTRDQETQSTTTRV